MKYRVTEEHSYGEKAVKLYRTEAPTMEAEYALLMLERCGLVAADMDGEDSAGRQKIKMFPVKDTVERAFDLAQEAFRVARSRGLMAQLPDLNEVNADVDARRAAKQAKEDAKA